MAPMLKTYEMSEIEKKWYPFWEENGYFKADKNEQKESYTIVIPPPNVTGVLTLGHVLNNTLQDILIRQKKMQGHDTCWVPGTDHAGIATQAKVERFLRETENVTRHDLGREEFLKQVWEWKDKYGGTIIRQLRSLGTACDWDRERFTLDPGLSEAVREVFIQLYNDGLIYKGHRIINWCPASQTALSDEEVIYREEQGNLWYFRYALEDDPHQWIVVATTRPETMLGDAAVAVHPDDERYADFIGRNVVLPIVNRPIPVVVDEYVDRQFGTGAVKITPAHDPNDYELGLRHDLPIIDVMNDDATMNAQAGAEFEGIDRYECRKAVVRELEDLGALDHIEEHQHQVGYSERGNVPVEPRLSEQWFVKMKPLADPALKAVESGEIQFHPERWVKTYKHWMENIKDWCISRQLWWGHRIPAYYCQNCDHVQVEKQMPESCAVCAHTEFRQDEDVLDTWFSSWLWPFSVFGWPEEKEDLDHYYPTDALVTAPDIIFFWVARMIMSGLKFMGEIPFKDVYFTSLIRDDMGRKLSKSLNNSPDPLDVIEEFGADALRFTVIYLAPMGQDIRYSNDKCKIGRNFATKLWNAAKFREFQGGDIFSDTLDQIDETQLRSDDRWVLARLNQVTTQVNGALDEFHFHEYVHAMYEFVWNEFCDWYLESAKAVFNNGDQASRETVLQVFDYVLYSVLKLLHPVMPFITEEIAHCLSYVHAKESIMKAQWPEPLPHEQARKYGLTDEIVRFVKNKFDLISAVRNVKASYGIPVKKGLAVVVKPSTAEMAEELNSDMDSFVFLTSASEVTVDVNYQVDGPAGVAIGDIGTAYIPLEGIIDIDAEKERLQKQEEELVKHIKSSQAKLNNEKFVSKAPGDVVKQTRERYNEMQEKLQRLRDQMNTLIGA